MSWLIYSLILLCLVSFNLLAVDNISKIRKDISTILTIVREIGIEEIDENIENRKLPSIPSVINDVSDSVVATIGSK